MSIVLYDRYVGISIFRTLHPIRRSLQVAVRRMYVSGLDEIRAALSSVDSVISMTPANPIALMATH